jgi:hypothetical protein
MESFEAFFAAIGPRPGPEYSLDRFPDCNGPYQPGNVRWATNAQQQRNKRSSRRVLINGVEMCLTDAAKMLGKHPTDLVRNPVVYGVEFLPKRAA